MTQNKDYYARTMRIRYFLVTNSPLCLGIKFLYGPIAFNKDAYIYILKQLFLTKLKGILKVEIRVWHAVKCQ